jgi:hypothetical protein
MKRNSAIETARRIDRVLAEAEEFSSLLLCDRILALFNRGIATDSQGMKAEVLRQKILKARGEW